MHEASLLLCVCVCFIFFYICIWPFESVVFIIFQLLSSVPVHIIVFVLFLLLLYYDFPSILLWLVLSVAFPFYHFSFSLPSPLPIFVVLFSVTPLTPPPLTPHPSNSFPLPPTLIPPLPTPSEPSAPPQDVKCAGASSTSLLVSWQAPPAESRNGELTGYVVRHRVVSVPGVEGGAGGPGAEVKEPQVGPGEAKQLLVTGLEKWTQYQVTVAAATSEGLGPYSEPLACRTDEDGM